MKRSKSFDRGLFFLIPIVGLVVATAVFLYIQTRTDRVTESIQENEAITMAFVFLDDGSIEATEVVMYHPGSKNAAILDIPSNVGMLIEKLNRVDRIERVYQEEGRDAYIEKLEELTGLNIPFVMEMNMQDFTRIVDLLGGLELFIPNPIEVRFDDEIILLPSGNVRLDGAKARTYMSFSLPDEGTIERVNRKQKTIQSFLRRLPELDDTFQKRGFTQTFFDNLETNLGHDALLSFIDSLGELHSEQIIFQRVLGVQREVDEQQLLFPHYEGKLLKETVSRTKETLKRSGTAVESELITSVKILNGTTKNGLASRTAQLLESFGYEVAHIGNAEKNDTEHTMIIDNRGNRDLARELADRIRCNRIFSQADPLGEQADITLILGQDFDGRYCEE
ncbi:MAG: LCP family protein [Spirochaetales bacterium]|nr:LCP family protein [Spirochaetales bacterium]MCF7937992.1 LCP family protein [Spirochaetales bacterium]